MPGEPLELEEALCGQRVTGEELGQLVDLPGPNATSTNGNRANTSSLTDCAQHPPTPDDPVGMLALEPLGLAEMGDEAVVGVLADRAGVEQDQVGMTRAAASA